MQTDKTAESVREFFNELTGITTEPIGADEIAKAKNYIALGFPAEFESSADLSRRLEELIVYQLPDDYFERYIANVQAVTADAVQKAGEEPTSSPRALRSSSSATARRSSRASARSTSGRYA